LVINISSAKEKKKEKNRRNTTYIIRKFVDLQIEIASLQIGVLNSATNSLSDQVCFLKWKTWEAIGAHEIYYY
jgi:hypothetical protein